MNQRNQVRYGRDCFPVEMGEATLCWEGSFTGCRVLDYSTHGMKVLLPAGQLSAPPRKKDILQVHLAGEQKWFSAMCVFTAPEADGSLAMGIYFFKPDEQNELQRHLFKLLTPKRPTDRFVSYEWEERIARLCSSDDPGLRKIGQDALRELITEAENNG
jgi:hypothetical protein